MTRVADTATARADGRLMPIYDTDFKANPFPFYDELRGEAPVSRVVLASGVACWLVTGYAAVRELINDDRLSKDASFAGPSWHDVHVNRSGGTSKPVFDHLLTMDAPRHTQLRKLVAQEFQPTHVARLRPAIERIVADALDALDPREVIDYVDGFATTVPLVVICELLGVPVADRPLFRRWAELLVSAGEAEQALIPAAGREMREYLLELARRMRQHPDASLYCRLARVRDRGEMTDDELAAMGFLLLIAGHETTAGLLSLGLVALQTTDGAWARLCRAPAQAGAIVEELLRYCSPIEVATPRFAREPISVGATAIAPGDTVFLALAAANRDPSRFEAPHTLDLDRDARAHLAFGLGPHFCLGASLARLEARIAFAELAQRFPDLAIVDTPGTITWSPGLLLRGLRSLPVRLDPRATPG